MGRHASTNSSNMPNAGAGGNDEALRRMAKLVSSLLARADCGPFREPVAWRELELWDYPKVIKKMMDLGTVKRKLERGQYLNAAACAEDVRLVWSNCKQYNADGSDFYLLAESFSKRFEDRYRKIRAEFDTGEEESKTSPRGGGSSGGSMWNANSPPPLEVKTKFASNLFRLNGDELGYVLQVLDLRSPAAIERVSERTQPQQQQQSTEGGAAGVACEEMEINVDAIDVKTFLELDRYIKDKLYAKEKFNQEMNAADHGSKKTGMNKRKR